MVSSEESRLVIGTNWALEIDVMVVVVTSENQVVVQGGPIFALGGAGDEIRFIGSSGDCWFLCRTNVIPMWMKRHYGGSDCDS